MKTVGIIAEFNPFHNGHKYLIDKAKKITKADNAVVICSGNFVQRGMPAIFDKSVRAEMALMNGADVVFELPVFYATASAELFARAAVRFLDDLNCIDYLCFGCESDNLKELPVIVSILSEEPEKYKIYLNDALKSGVNFPKARLQALKKYCQNKNLFSEYQINLLMSQPNNILAIEYLKALKQFGSSIKPVAIKRVGAGYNSTDLDEEYASATGIRNELLSNRQIQHLIPDNCMAIMNETSPITFDDFTSVLGYRLLSEENFEKYQEVSSDLSNRIGNYKSDFNNIDAFIRELQSKNFVYSGISRALLHILLEIRKSDIDLFVNNGYFRYARLLGFHKNSKLLSLIKESSSLDIISKFSAYYNDCPAISKKMLDISLKADELYRMVYMTKYNKSLPTEFERQIIIK